MSASGNRRDVPHLVVVPDETSADELVVNDEQVESGMSSTGIGQMVRYRQPLPTRRVLAPWLVDPAERAIARRWAVAYSWHVAAFHGVRVPLYAGRFAGAALRGTGRAAVMWWKWAFDREAEPLRQAAIAEGKDAAYLALTRQHVQRVKTRLWLSGGSALAAITVASTAASRWPVSPVAVVIVAFVLLGVCGRRPDRPVVESAVVTAPGARRFTTDSVVRAFTAAKLCTQDDPITFLPPGVFRDGEGFGAVLDLPYGGKASAAIKKREDLAAALDVDEVRLFLNRVRGDEGSARRLELWLADHDPYAVKPPTSPLLELERVDFWRGFPFGVDGRRRPIVLNLVWSSLLVGAIPRMGKTFAARIPVAAAALDPHVRLIIADGKGGRDWRAFEQVSHWYGSGVRTPVVEALVQVLRDAVDDMNRRYELLSSLPDERCPEGKLTPELARDPDLDMPLTLLAIDEVQRYLEHPVHGDEICELLTELAKVGPAAGFILVLATQKPDAKVIPSALRDNLGTRFALKTMTWQASEVILGTGTHSDGLDASRFLRSHKGVGYLLGADDSELADEGARIIRSHLLDGLGLARIILRARELRFAAGTLTGTAAGEQLIVEKPTSTLLHDVLSVFRPGEDRLWSETICIRLSETHPNTYSGWDPTLLGGTLKAEGVETRQISALAPDGRRRNLKGPYRKDVENALADSRPRSTS